MSPAAWIRSNARQTMRNAQLTILYLFLATLSMLLQLWTPVRPRRLLLKATNLIVRTATDRINANIEEHNARTQREAELLCDPYDTQFAERKSMQWIAAEEKADAIASFLFFGSWLALACGAILAISVLDLVFCKLKMEGHFPENCVFACGCEAIPSGVPWQAYVKAGTIWRLRGFVVGFSAMGVIMALYTVIFTIVSRRRRPGWGAVEAVTP